MKTSVLGSWLVALGLLTLGVVHARADESTDPRPVAALATEAADETKSEAKATAEQPAEKQEGQAVEQKAEAGAVEPAADDTTAEAAGLDIFQAIDDGKLEVKFVARSDSEGRLVLTNKTDQPIEVQIPDAFAGVPVAKQFGGGGGGGGFGGGGGGGNQSVGGGGGGGRGGGGGGGRFSIAPEKVERIDVPLICLDHGLRDPSSNKPYEIRPIEDVVANRAVVEIIKAYANGELPRPATQAAIWHANSEVSWIDLANKLSGTERNVVRGPYFQPEEIRMAMAIVHQAEVMTEGETLERRNWRSPSEPETSQEYVSGETAPMTVPNLDEEAAAEPAAETK